MNSKKTHPGEDPGCAKIACIRDYFIGLRCSSFVVMFASILMSMHSKDILDMVLLFRDSSVIGLMFPSVLSVVSGCDS